MKKSPASKSRSKKTPPKKKAVSKKPPTSQGDIDDIFDIDTTPTATKPAVEFEMLGCGAKYPSADRLALVAAIVHKGGKEYDSVKSALEIYDCCHVLLRDAEMEEHFRRFQDPTEDDYISSKDEYSFNDAVKVITGQNRLDRAIQYFSDYGMYSIAQDASFKTPEERFRRYEERMEFRKKEGFSGQEVVRLKNSFRKYFPTRRKKSVDFENSL
jgi:hypothetical protein